MSAKPLQADAGSQRRRLFSVDALRGMLIVLMALDHASYFVAQKHSPGEYWGGPFPVYEQALPFVARLVTHPAAPGFFFLMGASIVLFAASHRRCRWTEWAIVRHFLIRGALLIALQFLLVNVGWSLTPWGWGLRYYAGVLFGLGTTMIVAALLIRVEPRCLLGVSVVLVVIVALATPDASQWDHPLPALVRLLLVPGGTTALWVNYPVLPWLGLTIFGMAFGRWLQDDPYRSSARALLLGGAFLLGFIAVRYLNGFGNLRPRAGDTWIDFLNVVKYPPSIAFVLMTMGLNLILLGLLGRASQACRRYLRPLAVFGRTPLLFYVVHLFLYAGLGRLLSPDGSPIAAMLPFWLLGLALLYPVCLLFGQAKAAAAPGSIIRLA